MLAAPGPEVHDARTFADHRGLPRHRRSARGDGAPATARRVSHKARARALPAAPRHAAGRRRGAPGDPPGPGAAARVHVRRACAEQPGGLRGISAQPRRARGRERVRPNERAVLTHPTNPGDRRPPLGARTFASRPSHRLAAWRRARGTPSRSSTFSRGHGRQPGGRARDRAIAHCAAGDARPFGHQAPSPQPRPESWHPSRTATAASTRTAVIEARAGRRPRHGHRCACP
jgi:hypothetical protein